MTRKNGFTIVEVTITVTVIAIITAIGVVTYSKVQADSRDSERASKMAIVAGALEEYHRSNGEYPGCSAMTQSGSTVSTTLGGIDPDVLLIPNSAAGVTNSFTCTALVGGGTDAYAYVGTGPACSSGAACTSFTLQYRHEGTGTIKTIAGRHTNE